MEKILNDRMYIFISIILVGIAAFLLGGLFVHSFHNSPEDSSKITLEPIQADVSVSSRVYASARGKRYYPWWCDAGSRIAKENVVWYETAKEAEEKGYMIASACDGL